MCAQFSGVQYFRFCYLFLTSIFGWSHSIFIEFSAKSNMPLYLPRTGTVLSMLALFSYLTLSAIRFHFAFGYHLYFLPFNTPWFRPKLLPKYSRTSSKESCVHKDYTLWPFNMVTFIEIDIPQFDSWFHILNRPNFTNTNQIEKCSLPAIMFNVCPFWSPFLDLFISFLDFSQRASRSKSQNQISIQM